MATRPSPLPQRNYSFTDHSSNSPDQPMPGDRLDSNYDLLFSNLVGTDAWIATIISDTGALKPGVVFKENVDSNLYAEWEQALQASVQTQVDEAANSAAAAEVSAANAKASEDQVRADADSASSAASRAATSEANASASANKAGGSELAAEAAAAAAITSVSDANGEAEAARVSEQAGFLWAEFMDGPVKATGSGIDTPPVGDGYYSARWWANYAEQKANQPGQIREETYQVDGTGNIEVDIDVMDFSSQTGGTSCVTIEAGTSYVFSHNDTLYKYVGPTGECIGLNGSYDTQAGDFTATGTPVHNSLSGRDVADAHPILAITGLQTALAGKSATDHTHDATSLPNAGWVEKAGDEMTGDLAMKRLAVGMPSGIIMHDGDDAPHGGIIASDDFSATNNSELVVAADDLRGGADGDEVGLHLSGAYIHLDAETLGLELPGPEVAARLIVAGIASNGAALIGYEAPPAPDYEVGCTNNTAFLVGSGTVTGADMLLCTLIVGQDIPVGQSTAYINLRITEVGGKSGTLEVGSAINSGAITYGHSYTVGAGFDGTIADSSVVQTAVVNGDKVEFFLRATGDNPNSEIWHRGDLNVSTVDIRYLATGIHSELFGLDDPDSHPVAAITGLEQALIDATRVNVVDIPASGSVSVDQARTNYYNVSAAAVTVTIPAGLQIGEQFTVMCLADTVFSVDASYTDLTFPATKQIAPFEAGSSVTFTCVSAAGLDISGDLADA